MDFSILKLVPHPVFKPWGLIHGALRDVTGISASVGELWLASAQTGPGNASSGIYGAGCDLAGLLEGAERNSMLEGWLGHAGMQALKSASCRGKTEAWHVRDTCGLTGLAAGPSTEGEMHRLKELLATARPGADVRGWSPEVRRLFGVITPLEAGASYLVPAGTLHTMFALGDGSRLVIDEVQQGYGTGRLPTLAKTLLVEDSLLSIQVHPDDETVRRAAAGEIEADQDLQANPTVRVYDFGRRPGEDPELGFRIANADAGLRRVRQLAVELPGCQWTLVVLCRQFVMSRMVMEPGSELRDMPAFRAYRVVHCAGGSLELFCENCNCTLAAGETAFVPGALESSLAFRTGRGCVVLDHSVPDIDALRNWCVGRGTDMQDFEKLLSPPRA